MKVMLRLNERSSWQGLFTAQTLVVEDDSAMFLISFEIMFSLSHIGIGLLIKVALLLCR